MRLAIQQFRLNINSVRQLDALYLQFSTILPALDLSEILRAEIVLSVSALDCFIHDLIRLATIEIYSGLRDYGANSIKPDQNPERLNRLLRLSKAEQLSEIDFEVRKLHKTKSFQKPEIIRDNILKIGVENIWLRISNDLNIPQVELENTLQLIIERRDAIVHEADIDVSTGFKRSIEQLDTSNNVKLIELICESMYRISASNSSRDN
ncbi:MAG: HEPN domain-containing protein [Cytophagales bacterium]